MKKHQRLPRTRERALEIYNWVRKFQHEHRYSPSLAEVSRAFGIVPSHVKHVRAAMVDFKFMWPIDEPNIERAWPLRPLPKESPAPSDG